MTNYSSDLSLWGATGTSPPSGYSYVEGEQPVDEWDNYVTSNLISDVTQHLIPLTNQRIDSSQGTDFNSRPSSPNDGHLFYGEQNGILEFWHDGTQQWLELWHEGNDGSGSSLNADMVDGVHGTDIVTSVASYQDDVTRSVAAGNAVSETESGYFDYFIPIRVELGTNDADAEAIVHLTMSDGTTASLTNSGSLTTIEEFPGIHKNEVTEFEMIWDNNAASTSSDITINVYGYIFD